MLWAYFWLQWPVWGQGPPEPNVAPMGSTVVKWGGWRQDTDWNQWTALVIGNVCNHAKVAPLISVFGLPTPVWVAVTLPPIRHQSEKDQHKNRTTQARRILVPLHPVTIPQGSSKDGGAYTPPTASSKSLTTFREPRKGAQERNCGPPN